jgi:hypothetical protein
MLRTQLGCPAWASLLSQLPQACVASPALLVIAECKLSTLSASEPTLLLNLLWQALPPSENTNARPESARFETLEKATVAGLCCERKTPDSQRRSRRWPPTEEQKTDCASLPGEGQQDEAPAVADFGLVGRAGAAAVGRRVAVGRGVPRRVARVPAGSRRR